jgi:hypothetical protein
MQHVYGTLSVPDKMDHPQNGLDWNSDSLKEDRGQPDRKNKLF